MFSKFTLLCSIALASVAFAAPSSRTKERLAHRRENLQSHPNNRVDPSSGADSAQSYSSNWSGAVLDEADGTFTTVTGTFTVPNASGADGSGAAIWVGIDGDTCQNAILQTGVDVIISGGVPVWGAWYEWYPAPWIDFSGITINAGDVIKASVTASSTTSGTAVIENLTTGVTVSNTISSSYALCEQNAEWIVEDFEENGSLIPFADFGTVTFTSATASGPSGTTYTPSGSIIFDIEQNGVILTSVSTSGETVTLSYI